MGRRWALIVIALAVLFTGAVLVWRFVYDDAPWSLSLPPVQRVEGMAAFDLYLWLGPICNVLVIAIAAAIVVRWTTGWRAATAWIPAALPVVVFLSAAAFYAPFLGATVRRIDRMAGMVEEPAVYARALALSVIVTMVLSAVFVCVTQLRRTPAVVRQSASVVGAVLAAILLNLVWFHWILPLSNAWNPVDWRRTDLLTSVHPCRGALLWSEPDPDHGRSFPVGRIDDIWLHFADAEAPGGSVWAVSAAGEWRNDYIWFRREDLAKLRVRRDDPALVRCDSRVRSDSVAPASWHRRGVE
jgi:hypothetical protein